MTAAAKKPRRKARRSADPLEKLRQEDAELRLNALPPPVTLALEAPRVSVREVDECEVECEHPYAVVLSDADSAVVVLSYNDRALAAEHAARIAAALAWDWRQS